MKVAKSEQGEFLTKKNYRNNYLEEKCKDRRSLVKDVCWRVSWDKTGSWSQGEPWQHTGHNLKSRFAMRGDRQGTYRKGGGKQNRSFKFFDVKNHAKKVISSFLLAFRSSFFLSTIFFWYSLRNSSLLFFLYSSWTLSKSMLFLYSLPTFFFSSTSGFRIFWICGKLYL